MSDMQRKALLTALLATGLAGGLTAQGKHDWPMWGRDATRNMVSSVKGIPATFSPGEFKKNSEEVDMKTTKNVKWVVKLGSQTYGNPTVANGRIYVGTNNDSPRDPRFKGDRSCVYCFEEKTGELIWQLNIPKLGTGKVSDWEFLGICCSPCVVGDRVYIVTNRCEVMCLDVHGMANGNDGPYKDEGLYMAWPKKKPMPVKKTDADIIWITNMIDECGVFPHNITCSSLMVVDGKVWTATSNGVDYGHVETPAPRAPCLICVDQKTGKLLGEESSGLSSRIFHSNWVSPTFLQTKKQKRVIFGGPDGVLYAFEPDPVKEDDFNVLKLAWQYDCNPPEYRKKNGKPIKYATRKGPSEVLGTPVVWKDKVYALIGQDPEHGEGIGNLVCLTQDGKKIWDYRKIKRSLSTISITEDGLLFAADYSGFLRCIDANNGKEYWVHDTASHVWGSTLVVDGKVYVGTEDGFLVAAPTTKTLDKDKVQEIDFGAPIYSSPIVANGVLYVATHTHLYAIAKPEEK